MLLLLLLVSALSSAAFCSPGRSGSVPTPDPSSYKDLNTSRGMNYHYYFSEAREDKPYLLFLHGFPSTSYDWRYQIEFFADQGYGLVVPDMLGYGGTSKPTDPKEYKPSLFTRDLVDILDAEGIERVVAIGHDWGSKVTARLANWFPERFMAFGFLAIGYTPPAFPGDVVALQNNSIATVGYNNWGYFNFFSQDNASSLIEAHLDSFFSLLYPADPRVLFSHFVGDGAVAGWLAADTKTERADFMSQDEMDSVIATAAQNGFDGPDAWYKVIMNGIDNEDNAGIPEENYKITKPTYYAGAMRDYIGVPAIQRAGLLHTNLTWQDYNTAHWVMIEAHEEFNGDLLNWVQGL